jgi:hypothetical protein
MPLDIQGGEETDLSDMSKARKKLKRRPSTPSKRPKRRVGNSQKPFITRTEARRRAERHVLNRMFKGARVRDGAAATLYIYIRGDWSVKDTWVVYKNPDDPMVLRSSDVILVCKRTGRVLYEGTAGDEG